jgi:predicted oxidoreductase
MEFSDIIAGTMTWGVWGKDLSTSEMSALIDTCLESGINTFDHADIYGGYTTEEAFGYAFIENGVPRENIKLISKCGILNPGGARDISAKRYEYSAEYIIWSAESSLKNLQTDYLDLLLLHRPSPLMQPDEIAKAVDLLKRDGKILEFGVSNFTPSQTDLLAAKTNIGYNQIQFSLTHWEPMTNGSLDHMFLNNIRPMAYSPLGDVFKEENEQTARIKELLVRLILKYEVDADVILLAWILKHPAKILPVFGTANPRRIRELHKATIINLDDEDWFALWVESRGSKVP